MGIESCVIFGVSLVFVQFGVRKCSDGETATVGYPAVASPQSEPPAAAGGSFFGASLTRVRTGLSGPKGDKAKSASQPTVANK